MMNALPSHGGCSRSLRAQESSTLPRIVPCPHLGVSDQVNLYQ